MTDYNTTLDQTTIDLIEKNVASGNVQNLLSLYEMLFKARDRAELNCAAYLHEIKLLSERFHSMTKPLEKTNIGSPMVRPDLPQTRGAHKSSTTSAIDIDL